MNNNYSFEIVLKNEKTNPSWFIVDYNHKYYAINKTKNFFDYALVEPYFSEDKEVTETERYEKLLDILLRFCQYYPVDETDLNNPKNVELFEMAEEKLKNI